MGKICLNCNGEFQTKIEIDGKSRNCQRRKYCLTCSPFGSGNTKKLHQKKKGRDRVRDKERYRTWQKRTRLERKRKLVEMHGGCCSKCSYKKCLAALEFHHTDPSNKKFGLAEKGLLKKWNDLVEEAKKCILLCANCHKELHHPD